MMTSCTAVRSVTENAAFQPYGPGGGGEWVAQAVHLDVQASRPKAVAIVCVRFIKLPCSPVEGSLPGAEALLFAGNLERARKLALEALSIAVSYDELPAQGHIQGFLEISLWRSILKSRSPQANITKPPRR